MKSTGIVRNIDELGRLVIPKEMRKKMGIGESSPVEIFVEDDRIIVTKYQDSCIFCGDSKELCDFKGKRICKSCAEEIKL
ncbi:MAG: AbrB/MazE/SpoVT family DNA-binding domain-containing protein [Clostridia bacterium]|nr:AbrB/MazE/SpoVT family DNA-binding domain-containing protein [Clostridia bacterium]